MDDKDNVMIESFFKQAAWQQIEDNGFTERVMKRLPDRRAERVHRLSRLWTLFCIILGVGLFFAFGGTMVLKSAVMSIFHILMTALEVFLATAPTTEISVNPWVLLSLMVFVLVYLPYQTARRLSSVL